MRFRSVCAALVALAAIEAGCGSPTKSGPATATPSGSNALLTIYRVAADVRHTGQTPFLPAQDREPLALNDTVRTDDSGFAEIDYPDGSLTRLDVDTTFTVTNLVDALGQRDVGARLDGGRVWNRVEKVTGSGGYSVSTPNAVATVRGTVFVIACDILGTCRFSVYEGIVEVRTSSGQVVTLVAGQELDVLADGSSSTTQPVPDPTSDPWLGENQALDQTGTPSPSSPAAPGPPLQVTTEVVDSTESNCVVTFVVRWTADPTDPLDPRFAGEAVATYENSVSGGAKGTQQAEWTGTFVEMTIAVPYEGGTIVFYATLVSVGGNPVDPEGATITTVHGHVSCG